MEVCIRVNKFFDQTISLTPKLEIDYLIEPDSIKKREKAELLECLPFPRTTKIRLIL